MRLCKCVFVLCSRQVAPVYLSVIPLIILCLSVSFSYLYLYFSLPTASIISCFLFLFLHSFLSILHLTIYSRYLFTLSIYLCLFIVSFCYLYLHIFSCLRLGMFHKSVKTKQKINWIISWFSIPCYFFLFFWNVIMMVYVCFCFFFVGHLP